MSEGRVPMVVAGLEVAADIFAEDVELAYRSIVLRLQPWAPGEASQRLILVLARGMGLIEPERLAEPDMAELISAEHDVDAVAREAGTIGYEILTSLGARYHRVYLRLEERRVGKECVRSCRSRWWPSH